MLNNRHATNMKKAIFLLAALCIANMGFAQLSYATLNHNDTMQVFTGMDALQRAHAAAVGGDAIILSSGVFYAVDITKAVSIRGAGMYNDTTRSLVNTLISGGFNIDVADSVNQLSLTGLIFNSNITIYKAFRPLFTKCRFQTVSPYWHGGSTRETDRTTDAQFINCIIQNWSNNQWNNYTSWSATGTAFYNCIIMGFGNGRSPDMMVNCDAYLNRDLNCTNSKSILNCILWCNEYGGSANNAYTSFNSLGINIYYYGSYFDMTNMESHHNYNLESYEEVFQTFRGTYTDGMSMALIDSIATTILGDDSTQVGIYGGPYPFDISVTNPMIGHISAARRTNAEGKLEVDIELINNNE